MKFIKHPLILYPIITLAAFILIGFVFQVMLPSCSCSLEGCGGCGYAVVDGIAHFSVTAISLIMVGVVLIVWFGIPALILGFIFYGIYKIFKKIGQQS